MSKYHSKTVQYLGKTFHSMAERDYFMYLKSEEQQGRIKDIKLQPCFILQETFKKNDKTYRAITYRADFSYITTSDNKLHVVDRKGYYTEVFKIKHKLFEYKYPDLKLEIV
jgi:translation elongation factor P/translation initiation factor 5A